jgi:cystathionine beta-lyase/cystathionine gamma-synthase
MSILPKDFTTAVHAGAHIEPITGAVMTPIFQTSTFAQKSPGEHSGFDYSRAKNPTRSALEEAYAQLEEARYGLAFASGLAAEQAIVQLLSPGDEVIVCDDVYGGTGRLFRRLFAKYQLQFHFVNMNNIHEVENKINANTKMLWVETPSNPTMKVISIPTMAKLAKRASAILVVDNTFASPMFQKPLLLGADIVIHSTTKYMGGHSDIIGGAIMTSNDKLYEELQFIQFAAGAVPAPFECFLLLRSIKTLAIRMQQHASSALTLAQYLEKHPRIQRVFYPGLASHPQHALAKEQMRGFSGMISFDLKGDYQDVLRFLQKLKIFCLAESLGGVESLINHPEKMTHASVPEDMRKQLGIGPTLLRLSVGIESVDDLRNDLENALR